VLYARLVFFLHSVDCFSFPSKVLFSFLKSRFFFSSFFFNSLSIIQQVTNTDRLRGAAHIYFFLKSMGRRDNFFSLEVDGVSIQTLPHKINDILTHIMYPYVYSVLRKVRIKFCKLGVSRSSAGGTRIRGRLPLRHGFFLVIVGVQFFCTF